MQSVPPKTHVHQYSHQKTAATDVFLARDNNPLKHSRKPSWENERTYVCIIYL